MMRVEGLSAPVGDATGYAVVGPAVVVAEGAKEDGAAVYIKQNNQQLQQPRRHYELLSR